MVQRTGKLKPCNNMSELILEVSAAKGFEQLQQVRHKIVMGLRGRTKEKDEEELQAALDYCNWRIDEMLKQTEPEKIRQEKEETLFDFLGD